MILQEKWQKDLAVYLNIHTTFIIEGNIHDMQPWIYEDDGSCEIISLSQYLHRYLTETGYDPVVFYNRVDGFHNPYAEEMTGTFFRISGTDPDSLECAGDASKAIREAMANTTRPAAMVIEIANTIAPSPENLTEDEIEIYTRFMLASKTPVRPRSMREGVHRNLTNLLFLVVEKVNDIPAWFYLNNPYVKPLTISRPGKDIRRTVIDGRIDELNGAEAMTAEERGKAVEQFASLTDGMTLAELYGIFSVCIGRNYSPGQIREAVKMFRYGETESHWDKLEPEKVRNVEFFLTKRVKGQEAAVRKASGIIRRAFLGMSGIQGGAESRPKGVLFFAGPTGTGKTELAKTIAEFVFGDETFVTRFDMSEYQQPHSDQKLLGAPPGYIGYSEGGQLTNAIKNKPFSVLLFDEIEKAHPSILDKFLQILDDGRLTDSAGQTVYFSESLIIFTSNLGTVGKDPLTGERKPLVTPDQDDYDSICQKLLSSIRDYFIEIQRPEILNRFGDNFVVFDFVREDAAREILDMKLNTVISNLEHEKGIRLEIRDPFRQFLFEKTRQNRENSGRGIYNIVESHLVNPLGDILVRETWHQGSVIVIEDNNGAENAVFRYQIN